ncbi:hypothetical protein NLI96_g12769 [Meripilus lineatus]|uniref:Uncharacterized protein n=1 Tax=Meripilus lineatus TaxID=2056292 RepID=A0AAD5UP94_9APHY|nr:hypothetical protein NLI96_g12769 [Physisporinus lineatus]
MDNPQYYQPLSAALHAPLLQQSGRPPHPSQYANYSSHAPPPQQSTSANTHREEEEEEEEDDDDVVEEELDHHDPHHSASAHSSPRTQATSHNQKYSGSAGTPGTTNSQYNSQPQNSDHPNASDEKRKPGRPRGSRNRKPRAPPSTPSSKAPANTPHPGFYQYPPAPGGFAQNQQFYEFQWRALNLCSEFYNAAEELIKAANPMVIAQCYQMGPTQKIDPLAMITEAKRVCDNLVSHFSVVAAPRSRLSRLTNVIHTCIACKPNPTRRQSTTFNLSYSIAIPFNAAPASTRTFSSSVKCSSRPSHN